MSDNAIVPVQAELFAEYLPENALPFEENPVVGKEERLSRYIALYWMGLPDSKHGQFKNLTACGRAAGYTGSDETVRSTVTKAKSRGRVQRMIDAWRASFRRDLVDKVDMVLKKAVAIVMARKADLYKLDEDGKPVLKDVKEIDHVLWDAIEDIELDKHGAVRNYILTHPFKWADMIMKAEQQYVDRKDIDLKGQLNVEIIDYSNVVEVVE
jgi:hypothetical protein